MDDYLLAENLLNYKYGYMRRSLLGNFFVPFPDRYWQLVIKIFYIIPIVGVIWFSIYYARNIYLLLFFLCSPFGMVRMVLHDFKFIGRKEFVFYIGIVLVMLLYKRSKKPATNFLALLFISASMILVHDSFFFLAFPVLLWILYMDGQGNYITISYISFVLFILFITSTYPDPDQIESFNQFFSRHNIHWIQTREYITISTTQTMGMSFEHLLDGHLLYYLFLFFLTMSYLFNSGIVGKPFRVLILIQTIFTLLLTLFAIDYGRWFGFQITSFFLCLFFYSDQRSFRAICTSHSQKILYIFTIFISISFINPHYLKQNDMEAKLDQTMTWSKLYHNTHRLKEKFHQLIY